MYEPLGPGDFSHPDELDDGRCPECGYEDCTSECMCEYCAPFSCLLCDALIRDDSPTLNITEDGSDLCDKCWKEYPDNPNNEEA